MSRKMYDAVEEGRKGGRKLVEQRGREYMAKIAARASIAIKKKDPDFYRRLSEKGVAARQKKKMEKLKKDRSSIQKVTDILTGKA